MSRISRPDLPLTPLQQGMLSHWLGDPASGRDVEQMVCTLAEEIDPARLRAAWERAVARHAALRLVFDWSGPVPVQAVLATTDLDWRERDFRDAAPDAWDHFLHEDRFAPFDLKCAPPMRLTLVCFSEGTWRLVWTFHHLLLDGRSITRILDEVFLDYDGQGESGEPDDAVLAEYFKWQAAADHGASGEFWRSHLAGVQAAPATVIEGLGTLSEYVAQAEERRLLSREGTTRLTELAHRAGVTLNTLVQGAWALFISRCTGSEDVVSGATRACRHLPLEGGSELAGMLINTVPFRALVPGSRTLIPWLQSLRRTWVEMRAHEQTPLPLVRRMAGLPGDRPLFNHLVVFEHDDFTGALRKRHPEWPHRNFDLRELTTVPLTLQVYGGERLRLRCAFNTLRFDARFIRAMLGQVAHLLGQFAARPEAVLDSYTLTTEEERQAFLATAKPNVKEPDSATTLHQWFGETAARFPDRIAVSGSHRSWTYRELDRRSNGIAARLIAAGIYPGDIVGLLADRSGFLIAAILGILKAGAAYLPVDAAYPADRSAFMLADAGVTVLLTDEAMRGKVPAGSFKMLLLGDVEEMAAAPDFSGHIPDETAYVIYTSGSTGQPKGCMVTHRNVVRLMRATEPWFHFSEQDVWTLFHSAAFDFSVWEIWGALLYGGRLCVVPWLTTRSPEEFCRLLCQEGVTILNQTPSAFRQLIAAEVSAREADPALPPFALREIIFGGEALEMRSLRPWFERHGDVRPRLVNMYGITETTVHVTWRPLSARDLDKGSLIGEPIPDLQLYVLDPRSLQPAPEGIPGEIYVAGAGLAKGYLNRPILTASRFPVNHLTGKGRLYRTGDLARFIPSGDGFDLEYLGRIDDQVKIRGFRIELGEITNALCSHPLIQEAAVLVREDQPGDKRLCAWYVSPMPLAAGELREYLKSRLPDYMLPAAFVQVESFPLTTNGKLDRRALPAPAAEELRGVYVPPATPGEQALADIWKKVLGVERVGAHDNFFELGGDSILSIQVIARARAEGLHLTPRQLFENPTVAALVALAGNAAGPSATPEITGLFPPSPIQKWFFDQEMEGAHHWNQSFLFSVSERLDAAVLSAALRALGIRHGALRLRFARGAEGWEQRVHPEPDEDILSLLDLTGQANGHLARAISEVTLQEQGRLNFETGPLWRAAYLDCGEDRPGRLLLTIHHLAVDGVSWHILLGDLEKVCRQVAAGKAADLPATGAPFSAWAGRVRAWGESEAARLEKPYWQAVLARAAEATTLLEAGNGRNLEVDSYIVRTRLSPGETIALIQHAPGILRARIHEILLTALCRAMQGVTGGRRLAFHTEGHGRESHIGGDLDVSRTVGWFTTIYPVCLDLPETGDPDAQVRAIQEQLATLPGNGAGFLSLGLEHQAAILFNYLGRMDSVTGGSELFSFAPESTGPWHHPRAARKYQIEINAMVIGGELEVAWTAGRYLHPEETIQSLARAFHEALLALAASGEAEGAPDTRLSGLDAATLARLTRDQKDIAAISALSPMQQLFYGANLNKPGAGYDQWHCHIKGPLDPGLLKNAWSAVIARHDILRASFHAAGLPHTVQIMRRGLGPEWQTLDATGSDPDKTIAGVLSADAATRNDLTLPMLSRFTLVRFADDHHFLLWSVPDLQLDGWSWPVVFSEVNEILTAFMEGRTPRLEPAPSYLTWLEWLRKQPEGPSLEYWRTSLAGLTAPTPLPVDLTPGPGQARRFAETRLKLEGTSIVSAARRLTIPPGTLVMAAWALLLARGTGGNDVVFGTAFSGRPADLEAAGRTVGPFVNNLPVRAGIDPDETGEDLLQALRRRLFDISEHQFTPLTKVQDCTDIPWRSRLFDSLVVFQNYEAGPEATRFSPASLEHFTGPVHTGYPLTLVVTPRGEWDIALIYQETACSRQRAETLLAAFVKHLTSLAAASGATCSDLLRDCPLPVGSALSAAPFPPRRAGGLPPRTGLEKSLAALWTKAFGVPEISLTDNFFDLGGGSLLLIRLHAAVRAATGLEVPLTDLFRFPTIGALAAHLEPAPVPVPARDSVQSRAAAARAAIPVSVSVLPPMSVDSHTSLEGIAIVGMAGRFPGASSIGDFWDVLVEGRETLTTFGRCEIPGEEPSGESDYVPRRGVIEKPEWFDAAFFNMSPREAEITDPQQRIFLEVCWHALEDAGCDPGRFEGSIGVFAGMSNNSWLPHQVLTNRELRTQVGYESAMIANEKDYLATRTAFKLDLKGPALNVYTACSTSLVAVCQAVQALQSYQCDAALAGGVSVKWPQERGYTAQPGSIYSPDGHCRPYDAAASGTVFSNGAGVVLLKRLEDAVRDGDPIRAVIKGAALNNDGGRKGSFTAPSVEGHGEVIALAQALAGFEADSIGYVEGHGTATPIGDPIEVAGLTGAFRRGTERTGFCGLGSLKSNFGHMDAASGVAGLIKAALVLQHRLMPATVHYQSPNPALHLDRTPFFLLDQPRPWEAGEYPRRAGVSSFGVGGTNAHVVLEEASKPGFVRTQDGPQVLVVSARSPEALDTACDNLAAWLDRHPDQLTEAAWTLQTGRRGFSFRRGFAVLSAASAPATLRQREPATEARPGLPVVFLFPGQGAQHLGMGAETYAAEAVFRSAFDECANLFLPHTGFDLREFLITTGDTGAKRGLLNDTRLTQPALFAVEYALALLLKSWGLQPAGMLGHSIGEYVAATLAGTFSLTDATRIVAARARIMGACEPGAMLAVSLSAEEVASRLPATLDIAAVNSPALTVVSGPAEEIQIFAATLESSGTGARLLHTSHAFHSRMMKPAHAEFRAAWDGITLGEPETPWISNLSGAPVTAAEATSPEYWVRHLRGTVSFAEGLATLRAAGPCLFVECGPGTSLSSLVRRHPGLQDCANIPLFPPSKNSGEGERLALLDGVGKLWSAGVDIAWSRFHETPPRRVSLPGYPFERQRYCPDTVLPSGTERDGEGWLYFPQGQLPAAEAPPVIPTPAPALPVAAAPAARDRPAHLIAEIRRILHRSSGLDISTANPATPFLDLGFDSLFLTQASLALKKHFGIRITFRQLMEEQCHMTALARWLDQELPPGAFLPSPLPVVPRESQAPSPAEPGGIEARLGRIEDALARLAGQPQPDSLPGSSFTVAVREQTGSGEKPIAFGPFRPLEKNTGGGLLPAQQAHLHQLIADYVARYPKTREFTASHRPVFADPRAAAGFNPLWKEMVFPVVTDRSEGASLFDIDGHRWIDVVHGFGSGFFGHKPAFVVEAIKAQLDRGYEIGPTSPLAGEVARLVCEFSGKDRVAFCNTGSEALMAAIRVSRTITGRERIAMFAGSYHGIFDEVLARPLTTNGELRAIPIAPGIPESAQANLIVLEYGHPESLEIIRRHAHELAAVLVEPVPSRRPDIAPVAFVQELRRITAQAGTALVFDEVVLGFRTHPQGAQHLFSVSADLVSYGKVIGGGMPLGVLAGTCRFMDALDGGHWEYGDGSGPETGVTFFAGTFIRHPLTMAAARAVLYKLKAEGPALQEQNDAKAADFVQRLGELFTELGVPVTVTRYSSLWMLHADPALKYFSLLFYHLRLRGIHIWEGRGNFVSLAHTAEDLDSVLAAFLESVTAMQAGGFLPRPASVPLSVPTTPAQREMFLQSRLSPEASLACHESLTLRLGGRVDPALVSHVLDQIVARHDALRSTFPSDGLTMSIASRGHWPLRIVETPGDLDTLTREDFLQPFDLHDGPLLRATLAFPAREEAWLILTAHHIVCDGWSFGIVVQDFAALYEGRILPPPASYADYAGEEAGRLGTPEHRQQREAWLACFPDVPPPLLLPADGPRGGTPSLAGAKTQIDLPPGLVARLRAFCAARRVTPYHVTLAAFSLLMRRLSGQDDFVIGTPAAAQISRNLPDLAGHCVQFLPLRLRHAADETGEDLLRSTRDTVLTASENDGVTFGDILDLLALPAEQRRGLVPVSFSFEEMPRPLSFAGLEGSVMMNPKYRISFEASFYLQYGGDAATLICAWQTALFDRETIGRWLGHYVTLLESLLGHPGESAARLRILTPGEERHLLSAFRSEVTVPAEDRCLQVWFEEMAARFPVRIAVNGSGTALTYQELNRRANRLAHHLRQWGVTRESLTGLYLERTPDVIVAMLAILKAGGAYLPIDPGCPADRLVFMLADAQAPVLLTTRPLASRLPEHGARVFLLDEPGDALESQSDTNPDIINESGDAAYVIYTSGSTGAPKGCVVTHHNVTRLLRGTEHWCGFNERDVWTLFHSVAFDFSVWEIWGALLYGGRLVVVPFEVSRSPEDFRHLLADEKVTVLNQTPSAFRQLISADEHDRSPLFLRWVIFGGEALEMESLRPWFERHGDAAPRLVNMYGITETTVHVTWRPLSLADLAAGSVIGEPIPDLRLYVLDPVTRVPVPRGVPGEIYVGGDGLARGYLLRPELTAERFLPDHLTGSGRLYKTGDLARLIPRASGGLDLEYLGRIDHQVKIRGFRIELGEIESVLNTHASVRESAVFAMNGPDGEPRLVAWLVMKGSASSPAKLRAHLLRKLPDYMVPAVFVPVDRFPLTTNGKLDRAALPAPDSGTLLAEAEDTFVPPRPGTETDLASVWEGVLGRNHLGRNSDFFALGGTSLNALTVLEKVHHGFGVKLPLGVLFDAPSLGGLAARIDAARVRPRRILPITCIQPEGSGTPLFLLHGGDGGALFYRSMLPALGKNQPVWVIESPGITDDSWILSRHGVESCAREYKAFIRSVYPSGPVILGGYSYGGVVAAEMCHLFEQEGTPPELLILFDTENPAAAARELTFTERLATGWRRGGKGLASKIKHLGGRIGTGLINKAKYDAGVSAASELLMAGTVAVDSPTRTLQIHVTHVDALQTYEPVLYEGPVVLFRSEAVSDKYARTADYNWRGIMPRLRVVPVSGDHLALFDEPCASELAKKLRRELGARRGMMPLR